MAFSFAFFSDPALTTHLPLPLVFVQAASAPTPADKVIWFGSQDAAAVCQALSNPGVSPVTVSPLDSSLGSGSPATDVKLALSAAGLITAAAGAAVALPATIQGGAAHAVAIHIRLTDSTHVAGVKTDLSLTTNPLGQL